MKKEYDFSDARRGSVVKPSGKTRITIFLDNEILEAFRRRSDAAGRGYQTLINEVLRGHLVDTGRPVDAKTLRRVLREELRRAG